MYVESFPSKLKKARMETGFTQAEIEKFTRINRSALAKYETGKLEPSIETLATLADFYEVSADWLLGTKGGSSHPPIKIPEKRN